MVAACGTLPNVKILYRYTLKESALFFFISLFAFTGVLLTLRMLRFANLIIDKGVEISQIGAVFISIIPTFLEVAIPLATLLGVMLAFARFSGDSEVVVMRASGISILQLVRPVIIFGLLASAAGILVAQELKPWGFRNLSATLFDIARTKSTSGLEKGVFNKLGDLTLYAERIDYQTGALGNVLIDDRRDKNQRKVVTAQGGEIRSDTANRAIVLLLRDGTIHEQLEGKYAVTRFLTNNLSVNPDELFDQESQKGRNISEMYLTELRERLFYLRELRSKLPEEGLLQPEGYPQPVPTTVLAEKTSREALEKRIVRTEIELGQRFSLPFASFALALLALPLGIQPPRAQRTWGAGLSATLGLMIFVLYYGIFSIGLVLAQNGTVSTLVSLWMPNAAVLALAAFALYKTSTEQWHSVAAGLHELGSYSIGKLQPGVAFVFSSTRRLMQSARRIARRP
jgi:lipopolysaccharide export system permease protein